MILIANMHNTTLDACKAFLAEHESVELPCEATASSLHRYLIRAALDCANSVMPPAVAGCVGSVEGPYATESSMSADDAQRLLEAEIEARAAEGCEFILFETLTTLEEIQGAARAVRGQGFDRFGIGLTCGEDGKTLAGVSMKDAVEPFSGFEPTVHFIQCTRYDLVDRPLKELSVPVTGVYANDGRRWENMCWHGDRVSPQDYGEAAKKWRDAGARIIGGCCGTRPEHIRYLKNLFAKES
jgi:S-methylmethionine-dependent homocysteine/selenocysteine methylase